LIGGTLAQLATSFVFNRRSDSAPEVVIDSDRRGWSRKVSHVSVRVGAALMVRIPENNGDISQLRRADFRIGAKDIGEDLVNRSPILEPEIFPEEAAVAGFPGCVGELQRLVECGDDQLFSIRSVRTLELVDSTTQSRRLAFMTGSANNMSRVLGGRIGDRVDGLTGGLELQRSIDRMI
jgi:hypothetical protein